MSNLSLNFLGSPLIELDRIPVGVDRKKAIALIAYLALTGTSHSRNYLATLLWPNYDQTHARASLRYTISLLRKALGGEWFDVDRERISLNRSKNLWLDVDRFHTLLAGCRGHNHKGDEVCPDCTSPLTEAVALYQDDFMTGFGIKDSPEFDDWQFLQAQSLQRELAGALEKLVRCQVTEGEFEGAIGYAKRWLELDRSNEVAHRRLMESYAWAGQRSEALRQFRECERILKGEIGVSPQEKTVRLFQAIKEDTFPTEKALSKENQVEAELTFLKSEDAPNHNLPVQLTSFIGREREINEVKTLLTTTHLLTLTGVGGCGKTRLALKVAADLVDEYDDGVWLVELAPLSDPGFISQEIVSVLDLSEQPGRPLVDTLSDYLRSRKLLLILDNCEHLIEACATLTDNLLQSCPNLKVMAASREALGISGESTHRVPSLSTPDPNNLLPVEDLTRYEALNLFIDRAMAAVSTFKVTEGNAPAVTQICQRLDGIPLAIELAAARVKALSVEQILARLDDRFRLLTGGSRTALPRQQTLRAMIDWSYNQLSEKERITFNRLSVFMGGWRLRAAEDICADEEIEDYEILELLIGLVDKSLVVVEEASSAEEASSVEGDGGELRYRLLETVRQYRRDKILDSGEAAGLRDRHLEWYLALAEKAEPELVGPDQVEWIDRLEVELDNFRAALEWSLGSRDKYEGDSKESEDPRLLRAEKGLRLAGALNLFWVIRGYYNEGYQWLEESLSKRTKSASARAKALLGAGWILYAKSDYGRAVALCEESLALYQELGDKRGAGYALLGLGIVSLSQGDYVRLKELSEESLSSFREIGDKLGIAMSLGDLAAQASYQGDHERAKALIEESLALNRELGNKTGVLGSLLGLGRVVLKQGDPERAKELYKEGLTLSRELGEKRHIANSLRLLGFVALGGEDHNRATQLLKESLVIYRELGIKQYIADCLEGLAGVAALQGGPELGTRLLGAAERIREVLGVPLTPSERSEVDGYSDVVRVELEEEAFEAAWAEGRKMSVEEAIDYALMVETP